MDMEENLVIVIEDTVDNILHKTTFKNQDGLDEYLQSVLSIYQAESTGNQFGAGCAEYFFYVEPTKLPLLKEVIQKRMVSESLSNHVYVMEE